MAYSFYAFISRLKNITRWSLMRNSERENVQEHSYTVAVIAHSLAVIRRDVFGRESDPGQVAAAALFHDASEIFTGDLPTPIKYFNEDIMSAYKNIEQSAANKLLQALPKQMHKAYMPLLSGNSENETTAKLVKAADRLSAYIKCLEELKAGNTEFKLAEKQSREKLSAMEMPELDYFIEHFIPAYTLTLDELNYSFTEK